ncbi:hypothetical protein ES703_95100 [subsurface metagenome]
MFTFAIYVFPIVSIIIGIFVAIIGFSFFYRTSLRGK